MGVVISRVWGSTPNFVSDPITTLSAEDKRVLYETFNLLKQDLSGNGERLFILYFTSYPNNQNYFRDFRGKTIAELKGTPKLIAHGTNVMCAINGIILQLNEPATLVEVVKKVGYSHGKRKITAQSLQELKISILKLLKEKLNTKYTPQIEQIWSRALDIIFSVFQQGVQDYINDQNSG